MSEPLSIEFTNREGKPRNMDAERLARLLFGENADIGDEEALLIGDSVLNRRDSQKYPDNIADVIYQHRQYTPFSGGSNTERVMAFNETHPKWERYMELAKKVLDPERSRSNVTHYFSGRPPMWAADMFTEQIGRHTFAGENPLVGAIQDVYAKTRR